MADKTKPSKAAEQLIGVFEVHFATLPTEERAEREAAFDRTLANVVDCHAKIHRFDNAIDDKEADDVTMGFQCPGCKNFHGVRVKGQEPVWGWNNDVVKPTFTPSIMVWRSDPTKRCHSYVTDGKIQFLSDSFHELQGQTVELPDWNDD